MKRWLLIVILLGVIAVPASANPILRWTPADTTIGPSHHLVNL